MNNIHIITFGNSQTFCLRVIPNTDYHTGIYLCNFALFLNEQPLGRIEQESSLGVCLNGIKNALFRAKAINTEYFKNLTNAQILRTLDDASSDFGLLRLSLGDDFDDFTLMLYYKANNVVNFLWKLEESPFFSYSMYKKETVYSAEFEVGDVLECVQDAQAWLKAQMHSAD